MGFGPFLSISLLKADKALMMALAERWSLITCTFYLPMGEIGLRPIDFYMITRFEPSSFICSHGQFLVGKAITYSLIFSLPWISCPRSAPMVRVDLPLGGCTPICVRLPTGRKPCSLVFTFYGR